MGVAKISWFRSQELTRNTCRFDPNVAKELWNPMSGAILDKWILGCRHRKYTVERHGLNDSYSLLLAGALLEGLKPCSYETSTCYQWAQKTNTLFAWINIITHRKVWGAITYPFLNFNRCRWKIARITNPIPHITGHFPCWDQVHSY